MWGENNVLILEVTVGNDSTFHYRDFYKMASKILVLVKVRVAFRTQLVFHHDEQPSRSR